MNSKFKLDNKLTATDPTPPVAPETNTGLCIDELLFKTFFIQAPAVRPAVQTTLH